MGKLDNSKYDVVSSSHSTNRSKGVMILMRKTFNFNVAEQGNDSAGRIFYIKGTLADKKMAFISAYAPNISDPSFYAQLTKKLQDLSDHLILLGCDMNDVLNPSMDRSGGQAVQSTANLLLRKMLDTFSLINVWRTFNRHTKQYTFFSARHRTYSRIDYILATSIVSRWVRKMEKAYTSLSDHHANKCELVFENQCALRWKFNLTLLQDTKFCEYLKSELNAFISLNKNSVLVVRYLWDAIKGSIHNYTISYASARNRTHFQEISKAGDKIFIPNLSTTKQIRPREGKRIREG